MKQFRTSIISCFYSEKYNWQNDCLDMSVKDWHYPVDAPASCAACRGTKISIRIVIPIFYNYEAPLSRPNAIK